jgi:hypothetical protein
MAARFVPGFVMASIVSVSGWMEMDFPEKTAARMSASRQKPKIALSAVQRSLS